MYFVNPSAYSCQKLNMVLVIKWFKNWSYHKNAERFEWFLKQKIHFEGYVYLDPFWRPVSAVDWFTKYSGFSFEYVGFWPKTFFRTHSAYFDRSRYSLISTYHAYNLRVDGFCEDASTGRDVIYNFVKSRPLNFFA